MAGIFEIRFFYGNIHCQAISYGTPLRNENEWIRAAKSIINLLDPKLVIFWAKFFSFHFRDGLQLEMGPHFRSTSSIETGVWIWVSTHRGRQQALRYAENSSIKAVSICQASSKTCAACCALLPTPAHLRHHHESLGRGCCDCVDYESRCDVAQPQFLPRRGRGG